MEDQDSNGVYQVINDTEPFYENKNDANYDYATSKPNLENNNFQTNEKDDANAQTDRKSDYESVNHTQINGGYVIPERQSDSNEVNRQDSGDNVYIDIKDKEAIGTYSKDKMKDDHTYTQLNTSAMADPNNEKDYDASYQTKADQSTVCCGCKRTLVVIVTVIMICILLIVVFVVGCVVGTAGDSKSGKNEPRDTEMINTTNPMTMPQSTSPTSKIVTSTTTSSTTTQVFTASKYDVIMITDEWNPFHTYGFMTEVVRRFIANGLDLRLGVITQSNDLARPDFNVSLGDPENFFSATEGRKGHCCAKISDLFHQSVEMFQGSSSGLDTEHVILFVVLYDYIPLDTRESIQAAANYARAHGVDRIVSAGYQLYSGQHRMTKVFASTQNNDDIYSFNLNYINRTTVAHDLVDYSFP